MEFLQQLVTKHGATAYKKQHTFHRRIKLQTSQIIINFKQWNDCMKISNKTWNFL
jgi:hypothetical protein